MTRENRAYRSALKAGLLATALLAQPTFGEDINPFAAPAGQTPIAAPKTPTAPVAPAEAPFPYGGVWSERYWLPKSSGNGVSTPETWTTPKLITISKAGNPAAPIMIIDYDNDQNSEMVFIQESPTVWRQGPLVATFKPVGKSWYLDIVSAIPANLAPGFAVFTGQFQLATTRDGRFSRDRFNDDAQTRHADKARELRNPYSWSFAGFDGLRMAIDNPRSGKKNDLFKIDDSDYANEAELNWFVPYGIRGLAQRTSTFGETEAAITNEAKFAKGISASFGVSAGDKKNGFGVEVTHEKLTSTTRRKGTTHAVGIGRIERYIYLLDKANAALSDDFREAVDQVATKTMSPETLVDNFGSHYANAIVYGALLWAEKDISNSDIASNVMESNGVKANGAFRGVNVSGSFSQTTDTSSGNSTMFKKDDFHMVGGGGTTSAPFANADDFNSVPMRYDLRPISELVSPIFFPTPGNQGKMNAYLDAKKRIRAVVDARMANAPTFSDKYIGPEVYKVDFKAIRCTAKGDESNNEVSIYGKIVAVTSGDGGFNQITLFDDASGQKVNCDSSASLSVATDNAMVIGSPQENGQPSGWITFATSELYEDDDSVFDKDDPIGIQQGYTGDKTLEYLADGQDKHILMGGGDSPTLDLVYTVTKLPH